MLVAFRVSKQSIWWIGKASLKVYLGQDFALHIMEENMSLFRAGGSLFQENMATTHGDVQHAKSTRQTLENKCARC